MTTFPDPNRNHYVLHNENALVVRYAKSILFTYFMIPGGNALRQQLTATLNTKGKIQAVRDLRDWVRNYEDITLEFGRTLREALRMVETYEEVLKDKRAAFDRDFENYVNNLTTRRLFYATNDSRGELPDPWDTSYGEYDEPPF